MPITELPREARNLTVLPPELMYGAAEPDSRGEKAWLMSDIEGGCDMAEKPTHADLYATIVGLDARLTERLAALKERVDDLIRSREAHLVKIYTALDDLKADRNVQTGRRIAMKAIPATIYGAIGAAAGFITHLLTTGSQPSP